MQMNFSLADEGLLAPTNIKVIGVGGGGGNAVNRMITSGMRNVEFIAVNTDSQVLGKSLADKKLNIGMRLTKGFGAGGNAMVGQRAAEESREDIYAALKGADMVFITAGMGGGTGTGAAPVVAEIARSMGILTVAVVTKPFGFENRRRMATAELGIAALREKIDALVVVPNDRLKYVSSERITLANAFAAADSILSQGVQSIADIISGSGYINLDFADVESVMRNAGNAHMGVGRASGRDKAEQAALAAVNSPLLETKIDGARGVIVSITAPPDTLLDDIDYTSKVIADMVHPEANLIWGLTYDENLEDEIMVTVIATGFESSENDKYIEDIMNYKNKTSEQPAIKPAAPAQVQTSVAAAAPVAPVAPAASQPVAAKPEPVAVPVAEPVKPVVNPVLEQINSVAVEPEAAPVDENKAEQDDLDWLEPLDFKKAEKRKAEIASAVKGGFFDQNNDNWSVNSAPAAEKKQVWQSENGDEWPDLEPVTPKVTKKIRDYDDYEDDDDDNNNGGFFSRLLGGNKKKKRR